MIAPKAPTWLHCNLRLFTSPSVPSLILLHDISSRSGYFTSGKADHLISAFKSSFAAYFAFPKLFPPNFSTHSISGDRAAAIQTSATSEVKVNIWLFAQRVRRSENRKAYLVAKWFFVWLVLQEKRLLPFGLSNFEGNIWRKTWLTFLQKDEKDAKILLNWDEAEIKTCCLLERFFNY